MFMMPTERETFTAAARLETATLETLALYGLGLWVTDPGHVADDPVLVLKPNRLDGAPAFSSRPGVHDWQACDLHNWASNWQVAVDGDFVTLERVPFEGRYWTDNAALVDLMTGFYGHMPVTAILDEIASEAGRTLRALAGRPVTLTPSADYAVFDLAYDALPARPRAIRARNKSELWI